MSIFYIETCALVNLENLILVLNFRRRGGGGVKIWIKFGFTSDGRSNFLSYCHQPISISNRLLPFSAGPYTVVSCCASAHSIIWNVAVVAGLEISNEDVAISRFARLRDRGRIDCNGRLLNVNCYF